MQIKALQRQQSDQLIYLGIVLFFLGLVVGLMVPVFANPRMGVSSHIEGVMNGMFLVVMGLIWHKIALNATWLKVTYWALLYGTFTNWLGILVAAIYDAGAMLGVMAQGKEGPPLAESFVTFSLLSLSVAMLLVCLTTLVGLQRHMRQRNAERGE